MIPKSLQIKSGIIITIGMVLATFSYYAYQILFTANIRVKKSETYLYIPQGATFQHVTDSLQKYESLNDQISFYFLSKLLKYRDNVKPGRYKLASNMNNLELIKILKQGRQTPLKLTFNNIRLKEDLAEKIANKLSFSKSDFLEALQDDSITQALGFDTYTIMAMFIPNTYEILWDIKLEDFLKKMKKEYQKVWNEKRIQQAKQINLSPIEVSILASIVEAETNNDKEKSRIAGVYYNRLQIGMPLQADPTVKFAIGDFSIKRIYSGHLNVNSPYNTYKKIGLPPGPINIPSLKSIDAVLNYEKHKFLYFCANPELIGVHEFAESYAEHLVIANKYRKTLNQLKIK
jgi:UPF0755 protein